MFDPARTVGHRPELMAVEMAPIQLLVGQIGALGLEHRRRRIDAPLTVDVALAQAGQHIAQVLRVEHQEGLHHVGAHRG
ncbi:MAG: hypothetical protein EBT79_14475 [Actinobacteria bacterium]|nr:hypothetical protein [Actinomycetota bacterium]